MKNSSLSTHEPNTPGSWAKQHPLNPKTNLTLYILEFKNFIFAASYINEPATGSLAIATPKLPNIPFTPTQELFQGQNSHLASALAEMLANTTNKICMASVNLPNPIGNEIQVLHQLLQQYLKDQLSQNNQTTQPSLENNA